MAATKSKRLLGVGGMANVYKAVDVTDNKVVAVKILREEYMANEEFSRMFKNESKAIAVLSHPNIVKVYDVIFTDKFQSIVMEYIDGITLKEYIDQQKVLRWKEAVYFTVQILRALQHAHAKGIVHRDIKPHNIMLLSDGTVKMMDFGIARFARSDQRTSSDKAIGSVHYISPEQAQGGVIDEKTDIYSVGIMLFEMLTGQLPFEAESPVSVAIKQIQSQAVLPRSLNPSIPKGLEEITMKAMEKNPANRYQSATEMLEDIDAFKRDPSIQFSYKYLDQDEPSPRAVENARREQEKWRERHNGGTGRRSFPAQPGGCRKADQLWPQRGNACKRNRILFRSPDLKRYSSAASGRRSVRCRMTNSRKRWCVPTPCRSWGESHSPLWWLPRFSSFIYCMKTILLGGWRRPQCPIWLG